MAINCKNVHWFVAYFLHKYVCLQYWYIFDIDLAYPLQLLALLRLQYRSFWLRGNQLTEVLWIPFEYKWYSLRFNSILRGLLSNAFFTERGGKNAPFHQLLNQNSWKHQIWHAGWCSPKFFRKIGFGLMTYSEWHHGHYVENDVIVWLRHRLFKLCTLVCFLILNHKMLKLKYCSYVAKTSYDVIWSKFWPKNAQLISKSDFGRPSKCKKHPVTLETSNFQEIFAMTFDSKSNWREIKINHSWRYCHKNNKRE